MSWLISLALGWKWPGWAATLFGWAVPLLVSAAIVGGGIMLIYDHGQTAGGAKVTAKVERQHDQAVTDSRHDERAAQTSSAAIGVATAGKNIEAARSAAATQETIHAQVVALPAVSVAGASHSVADTGVLDASLDALVDRANRAAATADTR